MISVKELRKNIDYVKQRLALKQNDIDLNEVLMLDQKLRDLKTASSDMRASRNAASESIGQLKKAGKDATSSIKKTRELGDKLKKVEKDLEVIKIKLNEILYQIPNPPHESSPYRKLKLLVQIYLAKKIL